MRIEIWESGKLATGKLRNINAESLEYAFYLDDVLTDWLLTDNWYWHMPVSAITDSEPIPLVLTVGLPKKRNSRNPVTVTKSTV